ncbi:MAG TPA: LacI family DNA-binding transcriptional regulator [Castellaniella sp.]|uniref:LacI family DNA-binding transcriptional regulator n=1 Tax=Castellaniella sp. TaxID=1955812 RepID=UPI002F149E59
MTTSQQKHKRVTIADVAREAGLSPTTVSHSLNGIGQVDPETRQHVKDVAARLRYRPSVRAQRLRTGRSHAIALLSSMPAAVSAGASQLGFFTELAMGSARTALLRGYVLLLAPPVDECNPLALLDMDGAILLEPAPHDPIAQELEERSIPYVTIGGRPGPENIDLQHERAAELLLMHLLEAGARAPGLVLGSSGRESQQAFRECYVNLAHRKKFAPVLAEAPEGGGEQAGYEATRRLLERHPELDALCVPIDTFASGAARAAADSGRTVGRDLLLTTRYDGLRAQTCQPPLTAVDLHLNAVSHAAVSTLLELLSTGEVQLSGDLPAPTLIKRASTMRI